MRYCLSVIILVIFLSMPVHAATEKRVALVIGNSEYAISPLKNPVNDAKDIAAKLRKLGFEVIERSNLKIKQIGGTLREFRSKLAPGAVALVFYAGHGLQIKGDNYLPAVDADINSEEDVQNQSLAVKQIMDVLDESRSRLNLVFLDACRNNPYARSFRSSDRGLARVNAPSGTLISYATKPGSVAADGTGRNGLYTSKLLAQMDTNVEIEKALKRVVTEVKTASKGKQEPWMEGSIEGDFCFGGCTSGDRQPLPVPAPSSGVDSETEAWSIVKETKKVEVVRDFLKEFPKGKYAPSARLKLKELESDSNVAMAPRPETSPKKQLPGKLVVAEPIKPATGLTDPITGMEFVNVPGGCFQMGDTFGDGHEFEKPVHEVCLSGFAIGKYEVTQAQWKRVMGNNPSHNVECGDNCPVETVSWNDVQEFIKKLNKQTGQQYRLPTEAEWEYACRSGGKHEKYCGGNNIDAVAWYMGNYKGGKSHRVGTKQPNGLNIYDMTGNVSEWVQDWRAPYQKNSQHNPQGPLSSPSFGFIDHRVIRGGNYHSVSRYSRSSHRENGDAPESTSLFVGFRLAATVQIASAAPATATTDVPGKKKWVYINSDGKTVIDIGADEAYPFSVATGWATVKLDKKSGIIDRSGAFIIPPRYDVLDHPGEGRDPSLFPFEDHQAYGSKRGFIDRDGRVVIPPRFFIVFSFDKETGWATACDVPSKCGLIDRSGKYVIPPTFSSASVFSPGHAIVETNKRYGIIDQKGNTVIPPRYEGISERSPSCGLSIVRINAKAGLIDGTGQTILEPQFDGLGKCFHGKSGLLAAKIGAKWNLIDKSGNIVVRPAPQVEELGWWGEWSLNSVWELAPAKSAGKWGYIDPYGKWVINPTFDDARDFDNQSNRAPVKVGNKWGYIDRTGHMAIPATWDNAYRFNHGLAPVLRPVIAR